MTRHVRAATADTVLLGDPYSRRFIMCLWEISGAHLKVTPTVADELVGNVRQSERRHWRQRLEYEQTHFNRRYNDDTYRAILESTRNAAGAWIEAELDGQGEGGLIAARPTMEQDQLAARLARQIPRDCFRRPDHPNQQADRQIIAESVALGWTLLGTRTLSTIKKGPMNAWLHKEGHIREPLIVTVEEAVAGLHPDNEREACLKAALGAALPETDQGVARDVEATERFLDRLTRTHVTGCATWALDAWEELDAKDGAMSRLRANLPRRARATELARVRTVTQAANDAGYEREPITV